MVRRAKKSRKIWEQPSFWESNWWGKSLKHRLNSQKEAISLFANFHYSEEDKDICWPWFGSIGSQGYGIFSNKDRIVGAHVVVYCFIRGDFDFNNLELDHLCRNRCCVNPNHLEPVLHKTNVRRGRAPNVLIYKDRKLERILLEMIAQCKQM